jgi:hypothetical protein
MEEHTIGRRPNLSLLSLLSFASSFAVVRTFTILNPGTVLITSGYHVHHFWLGIILLGVGGWIGMSYNERHIDQFAAVIFGAGSGLIADEVGILVTFQSENYWAGLSYTFVTILFIVASVLFLVVRYSRTILKDLVGVSASVRGFLSAVFAASVSIAFLIDTDNLIVIAVSGTLTIVACVVIFLFLVQRIRRKFLQHGGPSKKSANEHALRLILFSPFESRQRVV